MQQKSIRIHPAAAFSPGTHAPHRTSAKSGVIMLMITIAVLQLAGCARKDPVAGLNELPREEATKLRAVPNQPLLATKIEPEAPAPPPLTSPAALCPQDWTYHYYDAQVAIPITQCTSAAAVGTREDSLVTNGSTTTTYRLTDSIVFEGFDDLSILQPPLVCRTSNGPWPARITVERGCIGTCRPVNNLIVVGVPNTIQFVWLGGFDDHPPGFEFVAHPTLTDTVSLGPCNDGPLPPSGGQLLGS